MGVTSTAPATDRERRISVLDFSREELEAYVADLGEPTFRAQQIWEWIYQHYACDFQMMSNLPLRLRERLEAQAMISPLVPIVQTVSKMRDTQKTLFRLVDGQTIESVLMLYDKRRTLCISSQVGCAMGCTFCATALGGLVRNLSAGEIVAQVLYYARYLADARVGPSLAVARPSTVTNIVLMGMGEPMHNYDNVWTALRRLTDSEAFGLGARHITLSTVGLIPMIDRMTSEGLQIGLAVSLHAPNDELRNQLVPINRRYPVDDLLSSVKRYIEATNRRVTFEYALMRGVNDSVDLASELGKKLNSLLCHVNLIPLNPVPGSRYQPTSDEGTVRFMEQLLSSGVSTTIRMRRGIEIDAGCGQLRRTMAA